MHLYKEQGGKNQGHTLRKIILGTNFYSQK